MPKFHKHKLLLDENLAPRSAFPQLNGLFDIKHVAHDLNYAGMQDPKVYGLALTLGRIIVTFNGRDFRPLLRQAHSAGVIDIPAGWTHSQIDTKLTALLKRHSPAYFAGTFRTLATEQPA